MGKIKKILENELVGGTQSTDIYPNEGHPFSQITVTGAGGTTYQADVIDGTKGKRAVFPMPNEDVTVNVTFI